MEIVEPLAFQYTIQCALKFNYQTMYIEGDNKNIINAFNNQSQMNNCLKVLDIIQSTKTLLHHFSMIYVWWIECHNNEVTHNLIH